MIMLAQSLAGPQWWVWVLLAVVIVLVIVFLSLAMSFGRLWVMALSADAHVTMGELIGQWLRGVDNSLIVRSKIQAWKAGLNEITTQDLESHYLARGRVTNVVRALISAHRATIPLDFRAACAIDLAGRDIVDAVNTSVNPKVIDAPNPAAGRLTIDGVAKNGIQLKVKARVTVKTNIQRLVGGATEETVIARVGEGIVAAIGAAETHKEVLEHPDRISKTVLAKGLDAGTSFEILSIDIADIDVGDNIGARLQTDQAEADKKRYQAEAERQLAMAKAREQEMLAMVQENRAKVVLAEAEIPKAIAESFRSGNLGIMDYYRLRNIQADTKMRDQIGGPGGGLGQAGQG